MRVTSYLDETADSMVFKTTVSAEELRFGPADRVTVAMMAALKGMGEDIARITSVMAAERIAAAYALCSYCGRLAQ